MQQYVRETDASRKFDDKSDEQADLTEISRSAWKALAENFSKWSAPKSEPDFLYCSDVPLRPGGVAPADAPLKSAKELAKDLAEAWKAGKDPLADPNTAKALIDAIQARAGSLDKRTQQNFVGMIDYELDDNDAPLGIRLELSESDKNKAKIVITSTDKDGKRKTYATDQFDLNPKAGKDAADAIDKPITTQDPKDPKAGAIASLYGLAKFLGILSDATGGKLTPTNGNQEEALELAKRLSEQVKKLPPDMVKAIAGDYKTVNKFLKDNGFDIQLQPTEGTCVASAVTIECPWNGKDEGMIEGKDGKKFPAFSLKVRGDQFYKVDGQDEPIIKLYENPNNGMEVWAIPYNKSLPGTDAATVAAKLMKEMKQMKLGGEVAVCVPKVNLSERANLDWLKGLTGADGSTVREAIGQVIVQMNEKGLKAKEALAAGTSRGGPSDSYVIKEDFILVVKMPGATLPVFAKKIEQHHRKAP